MFDESAHVAKVAAEMASMHLAEYKAHKALQATLLQVPSHMLGSL